jgi:hypothetical protein
LFKETIAHRVFYHADIFTQQWTDNSFKLMSFVESQNWVAFNFRSKGRVFWGEHKALSQSEPAGNCSVEAKMYENLKKSYGFHAYILGRLWSSLSITLITQFFLEKNSRVFNSWRITDFVTFLRKGRTIQWT